MGADAVRHGRQVRGHVGRQGVGGAEEMKARRTSQRSRAEWDAAMLDVAFARPGSREFMEVVEDWQERDRRLDALRAAIVAAGRERTSTIDRSLFPLA